MKSKELSSPFPMKDSGKNNAIGAMVTLRKYIIKNPFIRPKIIPPILFNPFKTGTLKILFTKPSSIFTKAFINTLQK